MSNSPLVSYVAISPNKSKRTSKILKITPHHMAGVMSVERCGEIFAPTSRKASSNYGIGNDGRIALYVPEDYRAWTSNSTANDDVAVTIEVSDCEYGGEWRISDAAWRSLIDLCVDICQRNGIERLNYTGDRTGNLTMHQMFIATTCPGPYLKSKFPELAAEVNKRLNKEEIDMTVEELQKYVDARIEAKLAGNKTKPSDWAMKELEEAKKLGITDGERPGGYAKREEVAAMFVRYNKKNMADLVKSEVKKWFTKIMEVFNA